jgi:hypothetical protein
MGAPGRHSGVAMSEPLTPDQLDTATIRRLAVEAESDHRTVKKRLHGVHVKGLAGHRVDRVLRAHGLAPGCLRRAAA